MITRVLVAAALLVTGGCATVAPAAPRFVVVANQRTEWCRIQVVKDVRSDACLLVVQCGRAPFAMVVVDADTCVP